MKIQIFEDYSLVDLPRGMPIDIFKSLKKVKVMNKELSEDINDNKTQLILKLMIMAAIYEFMYMHKTPVKVVISEYLKVSDFFLENSKKSFLNAILDKAAKIGRLQND